MFIRIVIRSRNPRHLPKSGVLNEFYKRSNPEVVLCTFLGCLYVLSVPASWVSPLTLNARISRSPASVKGASKVVSVVGGVVEITLLGDCWIADLFILSISGSKLWVDVASLMGG